MRKTDIEALKNCSFLSGVSIELITTLLTDNSYEIKTYLKGEAVFSPEYSVKSLAVILKGSAEVSKNTDKGTLFMSTLNVSDVFGMSVLFGVSEDFPTTVKAKEQMRVLFITKQQLKELFISYPELTENYLNILSRKIHFLNKKIERLSSSGATASLKNYLSETAEKLGTNSFTLPVSFLVLSTALGIGRTSLYRAFDELTEEGFLQKNGKIITLTERNETK